MEDKNLKEIIPKEYHFLLQWFIWIIKKEWDKIPNRAVEGGARGSGKTFNYLILMFLICLYLPKSLGVLVRLKTKKQIPDSWDQIKIVIDYLGIKDEIKSMNSTYWKIEFNNGSKIILRSVFDPQGNISMKGIPRDPNSPIAIIINEECNTFSRDYLTMAEEAIISKRSFRWDLFNTDSIKQDIVSEMQENLPVNMTIMKNSGRQQKIKIDINKGKNGEKVKYKTWFRRSNHIPILNLIPDDKYNKMMQMVRENPKRAEVAVWGNNGSVGKVLYPSLDDRHFINPKEFLTLPERLPPRMFKRYRVGIDEATQNDTYAMTLTGITHQNRMVGIETLEIVPPKNGELVVSELINTSFKTLERWQQYYENMNMDTRIRVEWAGNGTTIRQQLKVLLKKTGWNFTIEKARKQIEVKASNGAVNSMLGTSQPILEERRAAEDHFFATNQKLFYNISQTTRNQYEGSRDEEGKIPTSGGDDILQAFQYAEIPEYTNLWRNPPKISFEKELLIAGIKL